MFYIISEKVDPEKILEGKIVFKISMSHIHSETFFFFIHLNRCRIIMIRGFFVEQFAEYKANKGKLYVQNRK